MLIGNKLLQLAAFNIGAVQAAEQSNTIVVKINIKKSADRPRPG